ncbi:MAG: hypothetical protein KAI29_26030, partial [Cyclobacteriaceae bacterium]|nr:hypothetical protein [Cyclobacteriaceae bacterium]
MQKAEAQAREAQIEAALERVRSKAMAMHNSEDLAVTVDTFFSELSALNVTPHRCGMGIIDPETRIVDIQSTTSTQSNDIKAVSGKLKLSGHPVLDNIFENWKLQKEYHPVLHGNEISDYYKVMNPQVNFPDFAEDEVQYGYYFYFKEGGAYAWTDKELKEQDLQIFRRYTSVLSLTYRRYMDLKEAEAQAREAKIEAAMERVRAKSMAMHKSEQLPETAKVLFEQFELLGEIPDRIGIVIINKDSKEGDIWVTDQIGKQLNHSFKVSLKEVTTMAKLYKAWKEGKDSFVIDLSGQDLIDWLKYTKEHVKLPVDETQIKSRRVQQTAFFSQGMIMLTSNEPVADEIVQLLVRFAKVFDQAYTRFLDLQKAEEQAREALKQSSLDRVRGKIASMRSPEDLQNITPLIWNELEILEVPFIRCGVFIIDESSSNIQVHLTTPDGKPIGALNLPTDANELTINTVDHWRKKKVYIQHWNKEDFVNWMQSMISLGQIQTPEQYQGYSKPPESLDLHFIPFKQGMLYVGNIEPLLPEKIDLVNTLAEAFSIAYARYEDFVNLEEAKNRVENTLSELKSAQSQLIHSEKMASLGELTAGIAHEIQNPLNFV